MGMPVGIVDAISPSGVAPEDAVLALKAEAQFVVRIGVDLLGAGAEGAELGVPSEGFFAEAAFEADGGAGGGSGGEPNALLRKYVGAKPAKTVMAAASDIAVKKRLSACGVAIVL